MAMPQPGRARPVFKLDPGVPVWLKSILLHNKHGVFARKYANEEIPTTSKLCIVMAQCAIALRI